MNYLAHLFLSPNQPYEMAGNFMADMIKAKEEKNLHEKMEIGIELHRLIDYSTDHHPIFMEHRRALYPYFSKYAGVVLDIYYDYLLFLNWSYLSQEKFSSFEKRMYRSLLSVSDEMPSRIKLITEKMVADQWLRHYTTIDGMNKVFRRLETKVRFPVEFHEAMLVLKSHIPEWRREHLVFLKDIHKTVQNHRSRRADGA